nr:MAG TPA: hypothetical protein [Caudoviricetes sp.]DAZ76821.1 MAG TPA: hypothetical protein [Caudoviricetes sp.]
MGPVKPNIISNHQSHKLYTIGFLIPKNNTVCLFIIPC